MTPATSDGGERPKITLDMQYETLLFYFEAILLEIPKPTLAGMARAISNSHLQELERAKKEARIDELKNLFPMYKTHGSRIAYSKTNERVRKRIAELEAAINQERE